MAVELKVPEVGESISEVEIGDWLKKTGESLRRDEPVVTLESEKATVELPSPESGKLTQILKQKGETAKVGEVIGYLDADEAKAVLAANPPKPAGIAPAAEPRAKPAVITPVPEPQTQEKSELPKAKTESPKTPPAACRQEEAVPMTRLRRTVAERLVQAQHSAALLTTFNEVDMAEISALRKEYGEVFQQKYHVKLGFMSFFVKACIDALKQFPAVNAEVRGSDIVYHNFCDIGIAVGSGKGLAVPVLRNAERMSFAEVEVTIGDFGRRAKENKLKVEELEGGTFTITNGGIYGSLLSTPIINPPQSGVLGMHAIQERPMAREGQVVIRPMMYVALTYDHRAVDGREAISFLKRVKEALEHPARMLIEI